MNVDDLAEAYRLRRAERRRLALSNLPPELYHYTDVHGILGILKSGTLRATNLRFVNDRSELAYAQSLLQEELHLASEEQKEFRDFLKAAASELELSVGLREYYAVCFCEDGDLLSQWRAYGGRGGGYALGFHSLSLSPMGIVGPVSPYIVRKVIYDPIEQRKLIGAAISCALSSLTAMQSDDPSADGLPEDMVNQYFFREINELLLSMKHPQFREEQEWRLVYMRNPVDDDRNVQFRAVADVIVPYIEIPFSIPTAGGPPLLPLAEFRCGPFHSELAVESIGMLLRDIGYPLVPIYKSSVPLR